MERYEVLRDIGSGNFGVAKLVRDRCSGVLFAVKFIERGLKVDFVPITLIFSFFWSLVWFLIWVCV